MTLNIQTITVEPERLRCGLWGYPRGDISASYSADLYGEKKSIRKPFCEAGKRYVAMNLIHGLAGAEAIAYRVLYATDSDDIAKELKGTGIPAYYTGKRFKHERQSCIFGKLVIVRQRAYRDDELIDLMRRMYAYGGFFASAAGSYHDLLADWLGKYETKQLRRVMLAELGNDSLPQTQLSMRQFIEKQPDLSQPQLSLF